MLGKDVVRFGDDSMFQYHGSRVADEDGTQGITRTC